MNSPEDQGAFLETSKPVTLTAADGYFLAATRFEAQRNLRGHVVMAGATGVPQTFYRRFAEYLCVQGFSTLTLDYRGIGQSKRGDLKGFNASFLDWARLDLAAAVEAMRSEDVPLFVVGHSFGGHAFGLLPNHHHVSRCYTFGTAAGWHGWMPFKESLRVRLMWNTVLPILVFWKGYAPMSLIGVGEDLPLGVYRQWRRWCKFPHYFLDDPQMPDIVAQYARVRIPIAAANAFDDLWALPRSRDAFMGGYSNACIKTVDLDPRDYGGKIGHMGYFRKTAQPLWNDVVLWFESELAGGRCE